jgi:hypothetical protein
MSRARLITDTVKEMEYELAKQRAVQKEFPDAKVHYYAGFQSKEVNQNYTKFEFDRRSYGIWVVPYCEVKLEFDGKTEIIKVHSCPKANRLVYLGWNRDLRDHYIKFSRIAINFKNNEFREDMLNSCRAEIMGFIKNNPKYKMDDKHLEPRLKKLLVFT